MSTKRTDTRALTDQYNAIGLVYGERDDDVYKAIAGEKQLKGWRREKKPWLIARFNPGWKNLAADWFDDTPDRTFRCGRTRGANTKVPRLALAFARYGARDDRVWKWAADALSGALQ